MSQPWMAFYPGDFISDTMHLGDALTGNYVCLICHYWQHGGLPDDPQQLARICKMSREQWGKRSPVLKKFFHDGWKHKRIDAELAKASAYSEIQRSRINKRWGNTDTDGITAVLPARATSQPQPQSEEERGSEAIASAAEAPRQGDNVTLPPKQPVYTDSRHELFGEGRPILISLGLADRLAGQMIGSWLKQTHDDAQGVLSAIQRARDHRIADPIPWITAALKPGAKPNVDQSRSCVAYIDRLALDLARASGMDNGAGPPVLRIVSES